MVVFDMVERLVTRLMEARTHFRRQLRRRHHLTPRTWPLVYPPPIEIPEDGQPAGDAGLEGPDARLRPMH
jgi:hypothetical protein